MKLAKAPSVVINDPSTNRPLVAIFDQAGGKLAVLASNNPQKPSGVTLVQGQAKLNCTLEDLGALYSAAASQEAHDERPGDMWHGGPSPIMAIQSGPDTVELSSNAKGAEGFFHLDLKTLDAVMRVAKQMEIPSPRQAPAAPDME